jgi:CheY-like chemotaxis protein
MIVMYRTHSVHAGHPDVTGDGHNRTETMASASHSTILLVDHNPATRAWTRSLLRAAGYDVLEATSGPEALTNARRRPDLIILDITLSETAGFDLYAALRAIPRLARVPVVHVSADGGEDDPCATLAAGTVGYLTHPLTPASLIGTVEAFLRTRD